ncbi:hypothetical protein A2412_01005 [Candidatus Peribacteria bacterium RIFOXYC1_FULL_58_8]|nr:MAG: hypothetical protein A2412_01005 [Candidatus Peribacteria bacterium RIFOXYC1_FULL_58_8]
MSSSAHQDLAQLPPMIAARILDKMEWYAAHVDPLHFAKPLQGSRRGLFRFRVGDYRILVDVKGRMHVIEVFAVRHRREAYQS